MLKIEDRGDGWTSTVGLLAVQKRWMEGLSEQHEDPDEVLEFCSVGELHWWCFIIEPEITCWPRS